MLFQAGKGYIRLQKNRNSYCKTFINYILVKVGYLVSCIPIQFIENKNREGFPNAQFKVIKMMPERSFTFKSGFIINQNEDIPVGIHSLITPGATPIQDDFSFRVNLTHVFPDQIQDFIF